MWPLKALLNNRFSFATTIKEKRYCGLRCRVIYGAERRRFRFAVVIMNRILAAVVACGCP